MRVHSAPLGVALAVLIGLSSPATAFAAAVMVRQDQDQNEKERRRQEERSQQRITREAREAAETLKDVQDELDELGESLLDLRYADPFLQDYVNELGQSLVPKETPPNVLFSFRVLHDFTPNAMALPDGRIYLNTGLLMFVENEAQLAMILGHEIGHVTEQHYVKSVKAKKRSELIGSIAGAVGGAILGSIFRGKKGAAEGAVVGAASGLIVAQVRMNSYSRQQEDEADRVGTLLALDRHFDSRESVGFFRKLTATYGESDKFSNFLYGRHSRDTERIAHIEALLGGGDVAARYNELRASGSLSSGTGQMQMYASRMMRDVAIWLMDETDRYRLAKDALERVVEYRPSDPKALWALGRAYKLVGRTDADRAKALDLLQRAAEADRRNLFPYTHRDLGLMQARQGATPAAVDSIKKYILGHINNTYEYPPDLPEMYDYLLTFGDNNWTAPAIDPAFIRARTMVADQGQGGKSAPAEKAAEPSTNKGKPSAKPLIKPPVKKPGGGL